MAVAGDEARGEGGRGRQGRTFARLKKMAGTWKAELLANGKAADFKKKVEEHKDGHGGQASVIFRLTGAGSAAGGDSDGRDPHEMVSVYHLDGDELRMTHYCAAGNQPRLKLDRARSRPDHLIFVFDGGYQPRPQERYAHPRRGDHLPRGRPGHQRWESYMGGKSMGVHSFNLTKQVEKAAGH